MDNAIDALVARDGVGKALARKATDLIRAGAVRVVAAALCLKQGDAETARLENVDNVLDNVGSGTALLSSGNVGLERGKGKAILGRHMNSKVVRSLVLAILVIFSIAGRRRDHTVGREATGAKEIGVDAGFGVDRGGIHIGQAAVVGNDGAQSMALGGEGLVHLGSLDVSVVQVRVAAVAKHIDLFDGLRCSLGGKGAACLVLRSHFIAGDRTRVRQEELFGILRVEVGHEDFERLVDIFIPARFGETVGAILDHGHVVGLGLGRDGRSELLVGRGEVQVPVVTVHLAHHVGASVAKHVVEIFDLLLPAAVGSALLVGEQKVLPAVKDSVGRGGGANVVHGAGIAKGESSVGSRNMEESLEAEQEGRGAAGLENELVGKDKHARLGQEVGVDGVGLEDGEDLAVDHVEHGLPRLLVDGLEAEGRGIDGKGVGAGSKPHLKKLLGSYRLVSVGSAADGQAAYPQRHC